MNKQSLIAAVSAVLTCSACTDSASAEKALANAGYKNIQTDGYAFWGCGEDDFYKTKFHADAPNGAKVSGAVCSGLFKFQTIRTE